MGELVIENPVINGDPYRRYAWEDSTFKSTLSRWLERRQITPETYPRAVDLCAGDGSISRLLADKGWNANNIVCVDRCKSPRPLLKGVTWRYWDLEVLAAYLAEKREVPDQILEHQNAYDLVILWNGFLRKTTEVGVCNFFVRSGGIWFMDVICS